MGFEDARIGFSKERKTNKCKTFETSKPPSFSDDFVAFEDEKIGNIQVDKKNVVGFRQAGNKWKIRVCKK